MTISGVGILKRNSDNSLSIEGKGAKVFFEGDIPEGFKVIIDGIFFTDLEPEMLHKPLNEIQKSFSKV